MPKPKMSAAKAKEQDAKMARDGAKKYGSIGAMMGKCK